MTMGFDWKELVSKFKKHSRQFLHPCSFEPVLYISSKPETGAILPNMLDSERLFRGEIVLTPLGHVTLTSKCPKNPLSQYFKLQQQYYRIGLSRSRKMGLERPDWRIRRN
jgi:hypothetical protein